jgi:hypothetical protein
MLMQSVFDLPESRRIDRSGQVYAGDLCAKGGAGGLDGDHLDSPPGHVQAFLDTSPATVSEGY